MGLTRLALMSVACLIAGTVSAMAVWQSGMVDDEGGPAMQAWVEAGTADVPADLRLMCLSEQQISIRYGVGSDLPTDAVLPVGALTFRFTIDGRELVLPMQLEEMDGAFAAYLPLGGELVSALAKGRNLEINDPTGLYHPVSFTLDRAAASIGALRKHCR